MRKRNIIGLPCVGGKSILAPILCNYLENYAKKTGIKLICDICGGGGKIAFSLNKDIFEQIVYNEYEYGLGNLMQMLENKSNLIKINHRVKDIIKYALKLDEKTNEKSVCYSLFKVAKYITVRGYDEELKIDKITLAALTVIVIFGSVQNRREGINYNENARSSISGFLKKLYYDTGFLKTLKAISDNYANIRCLNNDCFNILDALSDRSDVILFADVPYWGCSKSYYNDWSYEMHLKFIEKCMKSKSKIMICIHENSLPPYLTLYPEENWHFYHSGKIVHYTRKSFFDNEIVFNRELDDFGKQIMNILAVRELIFIRRGTTTAKEDKKTQEYIICNFEIDTLEDVKFTKDAVMVELNASEDYIEYDREINAKKSETKKPIKFNSFEKKLIEALGVQEL